MPECCIHCTYKSSTSHYERISLLLGQHLRYTREDIYSDNGSDFNNAEFRNLAENFCFEVKATPAESPRWNGLLEVHNGVLTVIFLKIKEAENLDWETALSWRFVCKESIT